MARFNIYLYSPEVASQKVVSCHAQWALLKTTPFLQSPGPDLNLKPVSFMCSPANDNLLLRFYSLWENKIMCMCVCVHMCMCVCVVYVFMCCVYVCNVYLYVVICVLCFCMQMQGGWRQLTSSITCYHFFFLFCDKVSLCSPTWTSLCRPGQPRPDRDLLASASQMLGLEARATQHRSVLSFETVSHWVWSSQIQRD